MTLRVAALPSSHVYVRHLAPPDGDHVVTVLPDPPTEATTVGAAWWPPRMLEPTWLRRHRDEFDLVHVHFGFDGKSPAQLREWTDTLSALRKPLVSTVHDLRNPHHRDRRLHDEQLRVLLGSAAEVITLTPGAAAEVAQRYGRAARVLPHPHVAELHRIRAPRPSRPGFVVGVHCKSLRAGMDPGPVVQALASAVPDWPGARLRVNVHDDVMAPGAQRHDARLAAELRALARDGRVELVVHGYYTDDDFLDYLADLDVSVLPYRFGTHSGWLEACYDLGTTVVAPDCGYYAEQRPVLGYSARDTRTVVAAVERAYRERPAWRATVSQRIAERLMLADAHAEIYRTVLSGRATPCTS